MILRHDEVGQAPTQYDPGVNAGYPLEGAGSVPELSSVI